MALPELTREAAADLRAKFPPAFPVEIRRVAMPNDGARASDCDLMGKRTDEGRRFVIRLEKSRCDELMADDLKHEWAHALAWSHLHDAQREAGREVEWHDPTWGFWYARICQELS
jgi:hypothetical protein